MEIQLVSLYRCKHCKTRMFEQDTVAHLRRCQGLDANGSTLDHFTKGPKKQPSTPGAQYLMGPPRGRPKKASNA